MRHALVQCDLLGGSDGGQELPSEPPKVFEYLGHVVEAAEAHLVCRTCGARASIDAPHFRSLLLPCKGTATAGQKWFRDSVLAGREPRT